MRKVYKQCCLPMFCLSRLCFLFFFNMLLWCERLQHTHTACWNAGEKQEHFTWWWNEDESILHKKHFLHVCHNALGGFFLQPQRWWWWPILVSICWFWRNCISEQTGNCVSLLSQCNILSDFPASANPSLRWDLLCSVQLNSTGDKNCWPWLHIIWTHSHSLSTLSRKRKMQFAVSQKCTQTHTCRQSPSLRLSIISCSFKTFTCMWFPQFRASCVMPCDKGVLVSDS